MVLPLIIFRSTGDIMLGRVALPVRSMLLALPAALGATHGRFRVVALGLGLRLLAHYTLIMSPRGRPAHLY